MQEVAKLNVAVVGCFQNGKSTLINCLLDDYVAPTGIGLPTTHIATTFSFGELEGVTMKRKDGGVEESGLDDFLQKFETGGLGDFVEAKIALWKPLLQHINLIDTPGLDADETDTNRAGDAIEHADFALVIVPNRALGQPEQRLLHRLGLLGKPCSIVVNCKEQQRWDPRAEKNTQIVHESILPVVVAQDVPLLELVPGAKAWRCNLAWFWAASGHLEREIRLRKGFASAGIADELLQKAEGLLDDIVCYRTRGGRHWTRSDLARESQVLELRSSMVELWANPSLAGLSIDGVVKRAVKSWQSQWESAVAKGKSVLVQ